MDDFEGSEQGLFSPLLSLPSDALLAVLLHLNVVDFSQVSLASRQLNFLTNVVQTKIVGTECSARSEMAAATEATFHARKIGKFRGGQRAGNHRPAALVRKALGRLRSTPSVAFLFHTTQGVSRGSDVDPQAFWYQENPSEIERFLPVDCAVLSAASHDIQANSEGLVESRSGCCVLLASFDRNRTSFLPFKIAGDGGYESEEDPDKICKDLGIDYPPGPVDNLIWRLRGEIPTQDLDYWKIIFVYVASGRSDPEGIVQQLQEAFPKASIVGGICEGGHVRMWLDKDKATKARRSAAYKVLSSKTARQLVTIIKELGGQEFTEADTKGELIEAALNAGFVANNSGMNLEEIGDGIFGLAIGGDVPVRTIVSRGVRSQTSHEVSPLSSAFTITEASILRPGDESYPFVTETVPLHVIEKVKCSDSREEMDGISFVLSQRAQIVGIKPFGAGGFDLTFLQRHHIGTGRLIIEAGEDGDETLSGSMIDAFDLDGPACQEDLSLKLDRLKQMVADQRLLAGIMFSCAGRGPGPGHLIPEEMFDAKRFHERFPKTPCLGFYAGGEIGPKAMAGNSEDIYQRGKATLQGFTAVFALFIAPTINIKDFSIDDSPENVAKYMDSKRTNI